MRQSGEWRYHISTKYDDDVASGTEPSFTTALKKADEGLRQLGNDRSNPEYQQDMAAFDNYKDKKTNPIDDDCIVHGHPSLDKGYKDQKQVDFYKGLKYNLDSFFEREVIPLFDDPGFFSVSSFLSSSYFLVILSKVLLYSLKILSRFVISSSCALLIASI